MDRGPVGSLPPSKPPPARHRPGAMVCALERAAPVGVQTTTALEIFMWFRTRLDSRTTRPARRPAAYRLRLDALDDRWLPSLTPAVAYPAGPAPRAVLTANFNGDTQ